MRNIILKKMTHSFGTKHMPVIESFVDEFMSTNNDKPITSTGLASLEKELSEIINFQKPSVKKIETVAEPATQETTSEQSQSHLKLPNGIAWKAIHAYQAALVERQEKAERQKDKEKKCRLRKTLEKQMAAAREAAVQQREEDVQYAHHLLDDVDKYHHEEAAKLRQLHHKAEVERKFREEQIAEQAARKKQEQEAMRRDEQERIERIQGEIDAEKRMLEAKRQMQMERQRQVIIENEALRLHRIEQKRLAMLEDQRLMAEYAAKMDREAAEREQAFAKRMAALEAWATKFSSEGAGKVEKEEMLREERLLLAEQERKEKADAAEELRRKQAQKSKLEAAQRANMEMMRQKALKAEEDRKNDEKLARMSAMEVQEFRRQEEERLRREAQQRIRFRNVLDNQLKERAEAAQLSEMTPVEKVMNKGTLEAIEHADKEIRDAVRRKLRI